MKHGERKPFLYRGPADKLVDRLAELERHRRHVRSELRLLEKLLAEHPDLRKRLPNVEITGRLRLVVDNGARDLSLARKNLGPRYCRNSAVKS